MEKLVSDLKKIMAFKETVEVGDIVLLAAKKPQMLVYALVSDIVRGGGELRGGRRTPRLPRALGRRVADRHDRRVQRRAGNLAFLARTGLVWTSPVANRRRVQARAFKIFFQ